MKNIQGHLASAIKRFCKIIKKTGEETPLFREATKRLDDKDKKAFIEFVLTFDKSYKTWNKLRIFFSDKIEFGIIFVEMIMLLLTDPYQGEFTEWLQKGKMSPKNKQLLKEEENKNFYYEKFTLIRDELLGLEINFKTSIKKSREALQKKLKTSN